jgi:hypothetical protein
MHVLMGACQRARRLSKETNQVVTERFCGASCLMCACVRACVRYAGILSLPCSARGPSAQPASPEKPSRRVSCLQCFFSPIGTPRRSSFHVVSAQIRGVSVRNRYRICDAGRDAVAVVEVPVPPKTPKCQFSLEMVQPRGN